MFMFHVRASLAVSSLVLVLGCDKPASDRPNEGAATPASAAKVSVAAVSPSAAPAQNTASAPAPVMKILKDAKQVPAFAKVTGKFEMAITWTDKNGDNVATFARRKGTHKDDLGNESSSEYMTVQHVASAGGVTRTLRTLNDHVEKCEDDLILEVRDNTLSVTDLDANGIGELTFAYKVDCASDMSPQRMKLVMLENGQKYILRGDDFVHMPGDPGYGGHYKIDPSFKKGRPAFLAHAKAVWERIKDRLGPEDQPRPVGGQRRR